MGTYFIGVDYGTVHTKACLRRAEDPRPRPIVVNSSARGVGKYLAESASEEWRRSRLYAPKIIMAGPETVTPDLEHVAINEAGAAIARAIRAAIDEAERLHPDDREKSYIVQVGYPQDGQVARSDAPARYELALESARRHVQNDAVRYNPRPMNERIAPLVSLVRSNFQFQNEALLIVDGGGWTTHATVVRWVREGGDGSGAYSQHGAGTVSHGVHPAVAQIGKSLSAVPNLRGLEPGRALHAVVEGIYRAAETNPNLMHATEWQERLPVDAVVPFVGRELRLDGGDARYVIDAVVNHFRSYCLDPSVRVVWESAWREGWLSQRRQSLWGSYRLFLLGGAFRIGRTRGTSLSDPLAHRIVEWQAARTIPFSAAPLYPESDERFWGFENIEQLRSDDAIDAVPYLFVAAGYTHSPDDWPATFELKKPSIPPPALAQEGATPGDPG